MVPAAASPVSSRRWQPTGSSSASVLAVSTQQEVLDAPKALVNSRAERGIGGSSGSPMFKSTLAFSLVLLRQ